MNHLENLEYHIKLVITSAQFFFLKMTHQQVSTSGHIIKSYFNSL